MLLAVDLGLVRSINDSIHGSVRLSNDEMEVIQHPLFRRLNNVRQNSFLYNVFPTAKHTRFEHSIGVMHCAHIMLMAILENGRIASAREDIANESSFFESLSQGVGIDLYECLKGDKDFLITIIQDVRLAALLHDIGHGPLSHLFDSFAPKIDEFLEILQTDEVIGKDNNYLQAMGSMLKKHESEERKKNKEDIRIEHEHVSSYFAYKILSELGNYRQDRIYNILTILKPELGLARYEVKLFGKEFDLSQLLTDIVAGAPIDCDRMDYLKRDSVSAGVPYGEYSEERVLKTLLAYATFDGKLHMGLKESGLHAIESVLIARYQMYVQVYGHKTNEACNAMLKYISKGERLAFSEWSRKTLNADQFISLYIELSDTEFLERLKEKMPPNVKQTISELQNRDLWKRVYEIEEYVSLPDQETQVKAEFLASYNELEDRYGKENFEKYIGDRFPLKDMKAEKGAKILEKKSRSHYVVSNKELRSSSQIIESLNKGLRILRIYSLNKEHAGEFKKYANSVIHQRILQAEEADKNKALKGN
ncbi:HD domain-containing protein [Brevibacillus brevis]|uniref:HD domain-containing protein n=1 Tax=Brevibacillus brevis TaxID=1393 RepID=UPI0025A5CFEC|nr:HD domain-containing protein [Brevibacillus brevis]WJQ81011.1 HD domain-containing protein [Brevibacillus brevis]